MSNTDPINLHFRVLSDEKIERIYQATLECLQRTGVKVLNAEARDLFARAGPMWTTSGCATLMLDLIDRVGPGGEFISQIETAKNFRKEIWLPRLMDRQPWNQWANKGSLSMLDRIREILETHTPHPLPDGAVEKIAAILEQEQ